MMESILLAVLCLSSGWLILPCRPLRHYHFVNEALTWHEAQTYCREKYTDLATIGNMEEMNQLITTVSSSGLNSNAWIGLYSQIDWRWSDGFTGNGSEYRNWYPGSPFFMVDYFCVLVNGPWVCANCSWKYTFACYEGTPQDPNYVYVKKEMNWTSAQKYCREKFTDLATMRNADEHDQVRALTPGPTWTGVFRDPNIYWSDGSNFSFSNLDLVKTAIGSRSIICGAAFVQRSGKWQFLPCETRRPFVCHSPPPVKRQVVKLRIKLDDSSVDLNDPAVKADLLKKLQDRLKEGGVVGVTLRWREQPGEKVFHRDAPSVTSPAI